MSTLHKVSQCLGNGVAHSLAVRTMLKGAGETGDQYLVNNYQDVEMKKRKISQLTGI